MKGNRFIFTVLFLITLGIPGLSIQQAKNSTPILRPLEVDDITAWKSIWAAVISNNGEWFAYKLCPNMGDSEVVVRNPKKEIEFRYPIGDLQRSFLKDQILFFSIMGYYTTIC